MKSVMPADKKELEQMIRTDLIWSDPIRWHLDAVVFTGRQFNASTNIDYCKTLRILLNACKQAEKKAQTVDMNKRMTFWAHEKRTERDDAVHACSTAVSKLCWSKLQLLQRPLTLEIKRYECWSAGTVARPTKTYNVYINLIFDDLWSSEYSCQQKYIPNSSHN